jgi:hypothetical protein
MIEMTDEARAATAGDTRRREIAQGLCQVDWPDMPRRYVFAHSEDTYRQHRCGRDLNHRGAYRCRYCNSEHR